MGKTFLEEQYGLKDNTVDIIGVKAAIKEHLEWWVDRNEEVEIWNGIIEKASKGIKDNYMVFIIGSYGRGKSISLFKILNEAETKYDSLIIPIYLSFKGEEKPKPGIDFILRIFRNIDFGIIADNKTDEEIDEAIKSISMRFNEPAVIFRKIYYGAYAEYAGKLSLRESSNNRNRTDDIKNLARHFLSGDIRANQSQLKQLGIIRQLDNVNICKEYLVALLMFLKLLGYNSLLLAIDEFEYLFSLVPKNQRSIEIALLRALSDLHSSTYADGLDIANLAFFFGISESGWSGLKEIEGRESTGGPTEPLMDRVTAKIVLSVFGKEETEELIITRLKFNRVSGKFENNPLIPFTEDFVDFIYEITLGEPRKIITRVSLALDIGLTERVNKLDAEFAKRVFDKWEL